MRKPFVGGVVLALIGFAAPGRAILPPLPSTCGSLNENTPQLAVHPTDPQQMALHYLRADGSEAVLATTVDGGASWDHKPVAGVTGCTGGPDGVVIDPMLDMGAAGRVVVSESWVTNSRDPGVDHDSVRMFVAATDASGSTVLPPVEPDPTHGAQRGPVSFAPSSNDDVLVGYERLHHVNPQVGYLYGFDGRMQVVRSTDGGQTFGAPVDAIVGLPGQSVVTVALLRSGDAVVAIGSVIELSDIPPYLRGAAHLPQHIVAARSTDGGASFSPPVAVGTYQTPFAGSFQGCCIPDAAVGPDGSLYVAWGDPSAPVAHVIASDDGGQSWLASEVAFAGAAAQPAVSVAGDGTVGVFAYVAAGDGWAPVLARSHSGAAWSTESLGTPFSMADIVNGNWDGSALGPYQDIAGLPAGFAVAFTVGPPTVSAPGDTEDVCVVMRPSQPSQPSPAPAPSPRCLN